MNNDLREQLSSHDPKRQQEAIEVLGRRADAEALTALYNFGNDTTKSGKQRTLALEALQRQLETAAVPFTDAPPLPMVEVFLLQTSTITKYAAVGLQGAARQSLRGFTGVSIGCGVFIAILPFLCNIVANTAPNTLLLRLGFVLAGVVVTGWAILNDRRSQSLIGMGQLLRGDITASHTVVTGTGRQHNQGNEVTIDYHFRTPTGTDIKASASAIRNDLTSATLPSAGTSVVVLYRDENSYSLL